MVENIKNREIKDTTYSIRDTAIVLDVALHNIWNILNENSDGLSDLISQCTVAIDCNKKVITESKHLIDSDFKILNIEFMSDYSKRVKETIVHLYLKPSMNGSIENYATFVKQKRIAYDLVTEIISDIKTLETKIKFFDENEGRYI